MSFTLEPKAGPHVLNPSPIAKADDGQSARARAMAQLMGNQGQAQPAVPNQNQIAVEELGALKTGGQQGSSVEGQADTKDTATGQPDASNEVKAEPLSDKYAALARRERQLRNEIRAFKAQQEAAKATPPAPAFDESKYISVDKLDQDLLGTLAERGYGYDKIVERALSDQTQDPATKSAIARLEAKIAADEERYNKLQATIEEQQTTQRKQAVSQIRTEASNLVKSDPAFETIKETNSVDDVVELIEKTFDQDGILLSVEEAAQAVEDHLLEEAMKLTKIGKIQQRLKANAEANAAAAATKATPPAQTAAQQQTPSKTLTNTMGTTRQLSARERAILAAKGEKF